MWSWLSGHCEFIHQTQPKGSSSSSKRVLAELCEQKSRQRFKSGICALVRGFTLGI